MRTRWRASSDRRPVRRGGHRSGRCGFRSDSDGRAADQPHLGHHPGYRRKHEADRHRREGRAVVKITSIGRQAHGSTPERGVNAVYRMARLVTRIETLQLVHDVHPQLGAPTLNLGEIHGGAAPNIVPGECVAYLDIRTVPGMTRQQVEDQLLACCREEAGSSSSSSRPGPSRTRWIRTIPWSTPSSGSAARFWISARGVRDGRRHVRQGAQRPRRDRRGGGPGDDEAFHVTNEFVEVAQLVDFCQLVCRGLDLLGR